MPLFEQQQPHLAHHLPRWCRRPLIRARPHQQEFLLEQGDLGERGLGHRQRDDGGVEPAFHQFLNQPRRHRLAHPYVELGMHAREILGDRGQEIRRDRRDHADAQPPGEAVLRGAREIAEFIDRTQDVADAFDEFLP